METPLSEPNLHSLADINQVIHAHARLLILSNLYVLERTDYVFLIRLTGLTWGNLATHLGKLEEAGYITVSKEFRGKKPHTTIYLTRQGRAAFKEYKKNIKQVLDDLPD